MRVAISGDRYLERASIERRNFSSFADPPGAIVSLQRRAEAARVRGEVPVTPGDIASKADDVRQYRIRRFARV